MTSNPYTPDEAELIGCYAGAMEEQAGENYATAKADAERGIAKIKSDAALAAVENVLELHQATETGVGDQYWKEPDYCPTCAEYYPCPTVRAIEGASDE